MYPFIQFYCEKKTEKCEVQNGWWATSDVGHVALVDQKKVHFFNGFLFEKKDAPHSFSRSPQTLWPVTIIGEEKVATVSRLFFFSFMTTFDNFCPSVRPSVRPNRNRNKQKYCFLQSFGWRCERGLILPSLNKKPITVNNFLDEVESASDCDSTGSSTHTLLLQW